jgi:hypothetical protein
MYYFVADILKYSILEKFPVSSASENAVLVFLKVK